MRAARREAFPLLFRTGGVLFGQGGVLFGKGGALFRKECNFLIFRFIQKRRRAWCFHQALSRQAEKKRSNRACVRLVKTPSAAENNRVCVRLVKTPSAAETSSKRQGFLPPPMHCPLSAGVGVFTKRYHVRLKRNAAIEPVCAW